ncbi:hypothetical protein FHX74_002984 [Friedmanniella endophytica]|uniref:Phosphodiesterase n=1 Tax=Microlunatus kandeliicorticis TaxID=1759536 RepID=A0A7W3IU95_9ACTN|nr:DUF5998 family protein [Microlunatus kandeliicorticis]MBA8795348.1 hypothetical protein [Microlunatus kandeliicorticis]
MRASTTIRTELRADIESCGYFPDLVEDAVLLAAGDEPILDFVVHHEPTFDHDEIHRHLTILLLTPTRLIVGHTDDHPPEPGQTGTFAASSTEAVPLRLISTVVVTRVVEAPEQFDRHTPRVPETWATISWGGMRRVDLEPATCSDPQCEADHGYTGTLVGDDLTVRMSAAADGEERVDRLIRFATSLQRVAGV